MLYYLHVMLQLLAHLDHPWANVKSNKATSTPDLTHTSWVMQGLKLALGLITSCYLPMCD